MTKPPSVSWLREQLQQTERESARLQRALDDCQQQLISVERQLASMQERLAHKDQEVQRLSLLVNAPSNGGRRATWSVERLLKAWQLHHNDGLSPKEVAEHFGQPDSASVMKVFLAGKYYGKAAKEVYKQLGVAT